MKKTLLGLALATLALACASEKKTSVDDASLPAAMCKDDCEKACCLEQAKGECTEKAAAECKEQKVCPATGQKIN